jgi:hypothetical protein
LTRLRPTAFEDELERRLAILSHVEETDRRLPWVDSAALAAITFGSFVATLSVQAL